MTHNHVNIKASSDAAPPPDLASLMITAMALGAAHSHVTQTTREDFSKGDSDRPTVTTSTCVSFTFYTPSIPSPFANLHIEANAPPSSPISIGSTELEDDLSEASYVAIVDDPCMSIDVPPYSTVPPPTPQTNPTPVAATNSTRALNETPAPASNSAAAGPRTFDTAGVIVAATPAIPVHSDERWYCVTVGRKVGVFAGIQNVLPLVNGISGASYPRHSSKASADAAFEDALAQGHVYVKI